ncbi:LuxR C-terminal-related transcriptional regulator [Sporosarcina jiandibaonis]|uniref:LuxR C-terminal-related transcriptional regulator n=1 Tax=Sporosarcina jiandibaonis TaxID=2715535 RepID=UPI0015560683|nr:LuxR C-terminal-related transcriptional regulator [Sporosarcina jiandibaonis]
MPQSVLKNPKLLVSEAASGLLRRDRLMTLLESGVDKHLSIVRAPAGYGKTTLLSQWSVRFIGQTAWISLNHSDNDPIRFWENIAKAIGQSLQTDLYERLLPLLTTQPRLPVKLFVDLISTEINKSNTRVQLILDDYQVITQSIIHRSIARLIEHRQKNFRLIIGSQSHLPLPIIRWKADSIVQEITIDQLKFTYKETVQFLKESSMPILDLNTVHEIFKKTEGCPMSIKLVTKVTENKQLEEVMSEGSSGNNSYVSDYLFHELITGLSLQEKSFLLKTSILKVLAPEVCKALTDEIDVDTILSSLEKRGYFIYVMDEERKDFQYHNMFRDFLNKELRQRYSKEEVSRLFSKAAEELYKLGDFLNAIELSMRGNIFVDAMKWIEIHALDIFKLGYTETLKGWIDLLLKEQQELSIEMTTLFALAHAMLQDFGRTFHIIEQLEKRHEIDHWMDNEEYNNEAADFLAIKAYALLVDQNSMNTSLRLMLKQSKREAKDSNFNKISIRYNVWNLTLLHTKIGGKGKLNCEEIESFLNNHQTKDYKRLIVTGYYLGVYAEKLVEWNRSEEALLVIKEAIKIGRSFRDSGLVIPMFVLKCRIEITKQDYAEAQHYLEKAKSYALNKDEPHWVDLLLLMEATIFIQQDKLAIAEEKLAAAKANEYIGGIENEFWWFVHVRLLIKKKDFETGLQLVEQLKARAYEEEQISLIIESSLLEATLHKLNGNNRQALDMLNEALKFGNRYGYIRMFLNESEIYPLMERYIELRRERHIPSWSSIPLDYVERIMNISKEEQSASGLVVEKKNPLHGLTPRELEVLKLLTTGLSNRKIADELFLSPGTVRIYLSNIYAKLQVKSRTQAVIIANALSLEQH